MTLAETAPPPPTPAPQKSVWGFWPTFGFSIVIFIAYNAVQMLVLLVALLIQIYSGESDILEALGGLAANGLVTSIAIIVSAPIGLFLIAVFIRIRGSTSIADYLGLKPLKPRVILLLVLIFVAMLVAVFIAGSYVGDDSDASFGVELYRNGGFLPLVWLALVFAAPLFEEVFFRGFLFVGLNASRLGTTVTIVLTSLIWAVMHLQYNVFGIAQILFMGIILGIVRHKTGSLYAPLLIHMLWNAAATIQVALYLNS